MYGASITLCAVCGMMSVLCVDMMSVLCVDVMSVLCVV